MRRGGVPLEGVCSFCPEAGEPRLSPTYLCRALCTAELLPDFVCLYSHGKVGAGSLFLLGTAFIRILALQLFSCVCPMHLLQSTWIQNTPGADQVVDRHRVCPRGLKDNINITVHRVGHAQSIQQVRDAGTVNRLPFPAHCHTEPFSHDRDDAVEAGLVQSPVPTEPCAQAAPRTPYL